MKQTSKSPAAKIDRIINRSARYFSYIGGITLLIMAFMAFVNVLASKFFGGALNNVNDLIEYMLILVVYCCVSDCQLNGGGLMRVDILFRLFPNAGKIIIKIVGNLLGIAMYSFAAYQSVSLLQKNYRLHTLATSSATSFQIWPFVLIYIIGTVFLAISLLWSIIRMPFLERPDDQLGPYDYDLEEMNVHGRLDIDAAEPADDEAEGG